MEKDKKLRQFYQRKLPYESKKEAYHLGVSRESVFGEIGA